MQYIIDYAVFVFSKILEILNSIKLPGSSSLLYYFLGAIIIGFIFKLVKGSSNEFEGQTNFFTSKIASKVGARYEDNRRRKQQIVDELRQNMVYEYMDDNF